MELQQLRQAFQRLYSSLAAPHAHSCLKLSIPTHSEWFCYVSPRDTTRVLVADAKMIVWDKAPMAHRYLFEELDTFVRDIMDCDELSGW